MIYFFVIVWTTIAAIAITYDFDKEILKIKKSIKQLEKHTGNVVSNENKEMTNKEYLLYNDILLSNIAVWRMSESYDFRNRKVANWKIFIAGRLVSADIVLLGLPWVKDEDSEEVKEWWLNQDKFFNNQR